MVVDDGGKGSFLFCEVGPADPVTFMQELYIATETMGHLNIKDILGILGEARAFST